MSKQQERNSSPPETRRSRIAWDSLLTRALTLTTLGVPVLYLVGLAFDQGYQSHFAVPESVRDSDFHETLTLGFFALHYAVRIIDRKSVV